MNPVLGNLNHWLHLTGATIAVGGTIVLRLVVHPIAMKLGGEEREEFQKAVRRRVTPIIHTSILLLLVTGLVNLMRVFEGGVPPLYTGLLALKIILALSLFTIAILLTISSPALDNFNAKRGTWLLLNIVLGLAVILISAWLRWIPRT